MSVNRNVIANYLGTGWAALMGIAFLPVYIRYLGIEAYGLIGFFFTLQTWLSLMDMGLSPTLNREMARFSAGLRTTQNIRDLLKSMEIIYGCVALVLALLLIGLSSWIARDWLQLKTLSLHTASQGLVVLGLLVAVQWMGTLYRSGLLGLQHQVWLSITTAGIATLRTAGTIAVLALISPTITAFLVFQCGVSLIETALLAWYIRRRLPYAPQPPRFNVHALTDVWRFAAGVAAATFLAALLTQVDKLLLAKLLPLDQYGYFVLAVAVSGALAIMIGPLYSAAYPRLTALIASGDQASLIKEYHRFSQLLSIAIWPAALTLCVFSKEILFLWTQDPFTAQSVAPIVSVWVIGTALNGLMHIPYAAQLAHGWSKLAIIVNITATVVMVPAVLFWVPRHGAIAAAWIWVLINAGYIFFSIAAMHRYILKKEKWSWYLQDILPPLLTGVVVIAGALLCYTNYPLTNRLGQLGFLLASALLATVAAAVATPVGRDLLLSIKLPAFKSTKNE